MTVTVKAPRALVWALIAFCVVSVVVALTASAWAVASVGVIGAIVITGLALRWRREIEPTIRAAHRPGEPVQYVEVVWPKWLKFGESKFTGLFTAGWLVLVCLVLLVYVLVAEL